MIDIRATLKQAAEAYKSGDKATAQRLCLDILTVDPTHPDTLFLSSFLTDVSARQITLLQMALEREPNHVRARARLEKLRATSAALPVAHRAPPAPQTPAFSAPISSVPTRVAAAPAPRTKPPISPLPVVPIVAKTAEAQPEVSRSVGQTRRRSAGPTVLAALLAIVTIVLAAGIALTLLNRRSPDAGAAAASSNIVLVTRTPTSTPAPSETPTATATAAALVAGEATVPPASRTGPGSQNQPVQLGASFTLTRNGAPVLTLRIDEVIRGEEATRRITQASPLNPKPPPAYEYVLLRIVARLDPEAERAQIKTGDFVGFSDGALHPIDAEFVYSPPPELNTSFGSPGSETSGWAAVWVTSGDAAPLVQFRNAEWQDGVYFATTR